MAFKDIISAIFASGKTLEVTRGAFEENRSLIAQLQNARNVLTMAPTARSDVEAMLANFVHDNAAAFELEMVQRLTPFVRDARGLQDKRLLSQYMNLTGADDDQLGGLTRALCAAVPTQLIAAMVNSLSRIDWPENPVTLAERARKTHAIDEQLQQAQQRENDLIAALHEAGMRI